MDKDYKIGIGIGIILLFVFVVFVSGCFSPSIEESGNIKILNHQLTENEGQWELVGKVQNYGSDVVNAKITATLSPQGSGWGLTTTSTSFEIQPGETEEFTLYFTDDKPNIYKITVEAIKTSND